LGDLPWQGLSVRISVGQKRSVTSDQLVADSLSEHLAVRSQGRSLARMAQDLQMEHGRAEMIRHLSAAVRDPAVSPREVLRRIALLQFPVIVTTRYDTFLDEELARTGRKVRSVIDCRKETDDLSSADVLIRLLGGIEKEETIIVTEDDLWDFYGSFHSLSDSLKSLFAQRTILFIGYDPEDEGFRHLFSEILRFRPGTTGGCYLSHCQRSRSVVGAGRYWRFAEQDVGVYAECEALVLARQTPTLLRRIADPLVALASRRTLEGTVGATIHKVRRQR
jgi:hypothetical protein